MSLIACLVCLVSLVLARELADRASPAMTLLPAVVTTSCLPCPPAGRRVHAYSAAASANWRQIHTKLQCETDLRCEEVQQQSQDKVHAFGGWVQVEPVPELHVGVRVQGLLHNRTWLYDSMQQEPEVHRFRVILEPRPQLLLAVVQWFVWWTRGKGLDSVYHKGVYPKLPYVLLVRRAHVQACHQNACREGVPEPWRHEQGLSCSRSLPRGQPVHLDNCRQEQPVILCQEVQRCRV